MIAPVIPLCPCEGKKEEKTKEKEKMGQQKVSYYWQILTHFLGDRRWNHGTVNTCCQKSALLGSDPTCHPWDAGSGPLCTVWDAHQQKWFKQLWTQRAGRKSLRWSIVWFVAEWWINGERALCPEAEIPQLADRRWKASAVVGASVVIQRLDFTHVEPLWWCIDWKT